MNQLKLSKADSKCLGELGETFSFIIGREIGPPEVIELCARILEDKVKCDGIESVKNIC